MSAEEVAAANLGGGQIQSPGQFVHGPLQQADGLGPARPSVWPGGNCVGHHRRSGNRSLVDSVRAGDEPLGLQGLEGAHSRVAAHVGGYLGLQRGDGSVLVGGQGKALVLVTGLHRQQVLGAGLDEAHRAIQSQGQLGSHGKQAVLTPALASETAANGGNHHADLVVGQGQGVG